MWYSNQPQPSSQPTSYVPYNPWRLTSHLVQTPTEETFWLTLSQGPSLVTKVKHAHCSKRGRASKAGGFVLGRQPKVISYKQCTNMLLADEFDAVKVWSLGGSGGVGSSCGQPLFTCTFSPCTTCLSLDQKQEVGRQCR